ncbi:MAG: cellulase N-terminal Ig-like domain-containing protein [Bacteroidales bacterium]
MRQLLGRVTFICFAVMILAISCNGKNEGWIRINQLGYMPGDVKVAVFMGKGADDLLSFRVINAVTGKVVLEKKDLTETAPMKPFTSCYRLDFSEVTGRGVYRIKAGKIVSPDFRIADDDYAGTADFLLTYTRQQRCGFNPLITSMIVGLPADGDYPVNTHSSYVVKGKQVPGGLVDGPVYSTIFNNLKFIYLTEEDEYASFQTDLAVYHDDYADYSTNECTMDGTACLIYYLSTLQNANPAER